MAVCCLIFVRFVQRITSLLADLRAGHASNVQVECICQPYRSLSLNGFLMHGQNQPLQPLRSTLPSGPEGEAPCTSHHNLTEVTRNRKLPKRIANAAHTCPASVRGARA